MTNFEKINELLKHASNELGEAPNSHLNEACTALVDAVGLLSMELEETQQAARTAANTASCLANGIIPD